MPFVKTALPGSKLGKYTSLHNGNVAKSLTIPAGSPRAEIRQDQTKTTLTQVKESLSSTGGGGAYRTINVEAHNDLKIMAKRSSRRPKMHGKLLKSLNMSKLDRSSNKEPWNDKVMKSDSSEIEDHHISKKQSQIVFGHFKVPTYMGRQKKSWENLNPEELKEYIARKQKVKSKINQLTNLDKRNPSMKQRICIYRDLYRQSINVKSKKPSSIAKEEPVAQTLVPTALSQPTVIGKPMDSDDELNPVDEISEASKSRDVAKEFKESTIISNNNMTMASLGEYQQFSGLKEPPVRQSFQVMTTSKKSKFSFLAQTGMILVKDGRNVADPLMFHSI